MHPEKKDVHMIYFLRVKAKNEAIQSLDVVCEETDDCVIVAAGEKQHPALHRT